MGDSEAELDSLKSRLEAAEQRAKDSEAMMIQAAEYGKDLLEKNMAMESEFEAIQQEKHELNLRLQVPRHRIDYCIASCISYLYIIG